MVLEFLKSALPFVTIGLVVAVCAAVIGSRKGKRQGR